MTRPRWHLPDPGEEVDLPSGTEGYHYLSRVVRLRRNEEVAFFCGDGKDYVYRLLKADSDLLRLTFIRAETVDTDPKFPLELWLPNLKGSSVEDVIRSVVPLGVTIVRVYSSKRSVSKPEKDRTLRRQKVADEAVRQCGRTVQAKVYSEESSLSDLLATLEGKRGVVFHEGADRDLPEVLTELTHGDSARLDSGIVAITGPEGGLTDEELQCAKENGLVACRLGKTILRADLAPIVAVTILRFVCFPQGHSRQE